MLNNLKDENVTTQFTSIVLGAPKRWIFLGNPVLILVLLFFIVTIGNIKIWEPQKSKGQILVVNYDNGKKISYLSCFLTELPESLKKNSKVTLQLIQTDKQIEGAIVNVYRDQSKVDIEFDKALIISIFNDSKPEGQSIELKSNGASIRLYQLFVNKLKNKTKL